MATTNTASNLDRADVLIALLGGTDSTGKPFNKLQNGDTLQLKTGTSPTPWTSAITVNGNISVLGAGIGQTVITGAGAWIFNPVPTGGFFQLGKMTLIRSGNKISVQMNGAIPITAPVETDPANISGGMRIHDTYITSTGSFTDNTRTMDFKGWIEGVVDHCIWDFDTDLGSTVGGEHIIFNHNTSPTGATDAQGKPWNCGDWSWSHDFRLDGPHLIYFEDCIIKRFGGMDCNQDSFTTAGGARYAARHCFSFGSMGSGHESRSDGGTRLNGLRSSQSYKNLYIRYAIDPTTEDDRLTNVRQGENVTFGNRYKRWGGNAGQSQNTCMGLDAYPYSCWNNSNAWGGPDGNNPWDKNCHGTLSLGRAGGDFVPLTPDNGTELSGSIYASGHGGSRGSDHNPGNHTITLNGMSSMPTNRWVGFVIRNLNPQHGRYSEAPVSYAFITANGLNSFTVAQNNEPNDANRPWTTPPSPPNIPPGNVAITGHEAMAFYIDANSDWEIRRVEVYLNTTGGGTMATPFDTAFTGAFEDPNNFARLRDGTRRFPNNDLPGISQWDNQYQLAKGGAWAFPTGYGSGGIDTPKYFHAAANIRNFTTGANYAAAAVGARHPNFTYEATSQGGETNRVGPDAQCWALAPRTLGQYISAADGTTTLNSPNISSATFKFNLLHLGAPISGPGIPNGTTILSIPVSATLPKQSATAVMSNNATANSTTAKFTIDRGPIWDSINDATTAGSGGYQYPHPLVVAATPVPGFGQTTSASFNVGTTPDCAATPTANCVVITTVNFTTAPTLTLTGGFPAGVAGVTFQTSTSNPGQVAAGTCRITGNATGSTGSLNGTDYQLTIHAAGTGGEAADLMFTLTMVSPNAAPVVQLTAPLDNATFIAPANITLTATATDTTGLIASMGFYEGSAGTNLINPPLLTPPQAFTTSWNGVTAGTYTLRAKASDEGGLTGTSSSITITVNNPVAGLAAPTIVVSA